MSPLEAGRYARIGLFLLPPSTSDPASLCPSLSPLSLTPLSPLSHLSLSLPQYVHEMALRILSLTSLPHPSLTSGTSSSTNDFTSTSSSTNT